MSQNTSHRIGFKFWLNLRKKEDEAIADRIEILKNNRLFTQTIRDGIRIICDLRNGKLDVLFELFPWVRAEFMEYMRDLQLTTPVQSNTSGLQAIQTDPNSNSERKPIDHEQSQIKIHEQLERLEQLLLQQGNQVISGGLQPIGSGVGSGLQGLNVPKIITPIYDDDDDLVMDVQKPISNGSSAQNFLQSMQALQQ